MSKKGKNQMQLQNIQHGGSTGNSQQSRQGSTQGEAQMLRQPGITNPPGEQPPGEQGQVQNPLYASEEVEQFHQNSQNQVQEQQAFYRSVQNDLQQSQTTFQEFSRFITNQISQNQQESRDMQQESRNMLQQAQEASQRQQDSNNRTFQLIADQFQSLNVSASEQRQQFQGAVDRLERRLNEPATSTNQVVEDTNKDAVKDEGSKVNSKSEDSKSEKKPKKRDIKKSKRGLDSIPEDNSSDSSESSSEQDSSDDVSMDDWNAVKTQFKPKVIPDQFVQMSDLPPMQPGDDLHSYVLQFENSYCGALEDEHKIFKFVNKLSRVPELYNEAFKLRKRTDWELFKNKFLREKGKKQKDILTEFRKLRMDKSEDVLDYTDRLIGLLMQPAANFKPAQVVVMVWGKLPWWIQDEVIVVGEKRLKTITQFRRAVDKVHNSPTRKQIRELDRKYSNLSEEMNKSRSATPTRRPTEENRSSYRRPADKEKGQKSAKSGEKTYFVEAEPDFKQEDEEGEGDFQAYFAQLESIPEEEEILSAEDRGVQKRKGKDLRGDQSKQRRYNDDDTLGSIGNLDNFDSQQNEERPQEPMDKSRTVNFEEYARTRPEKSDIDRQIFQARQQQSNGRNFTIEDDLFFDSNGSYDLSLAENSIFQKVSFRQMRIWREQQQKGHLIIYHTEEDSEIDAFFHQIQEQGIIQSDVLRVQGKGEHLVIDVCLEGHPVTAIIDTGAQRTLVSQKLATKLGLEERLVSQSASYSLKGITGGINVVSYLSEGEVSFQDQVVYANIPVVRGCSFDMLLGQDILFRGLQNCAIHLSKLKLTFDAYAPEREEPQQKVMPLRVRDKTDGEIIHFVEEDRYPGLGMISTGYDLALMDLPILHPRFHTSSVPYQAYPPRDFQDFGEILKKVMARNSVILMWCSGKTIPEHLQLLANWGYTFVNILLVWVKVTKREQPSMGLGYWTRSNCEFLLFARKGQHSQFRSSNRDVPQTVYALADQPERRLHSSKPIRAYDIISRIFDLSQMKSIEFFARLKQSQVQQDYFDLYGDEIPGYFKRSTLRATVIEMSLQDTLREESRILFQSDEEVTEFQRFLYALDMDQRHKEDPKIVEVLQRCFGAFDCMGRVTKITNLEYSVKLRQGATVPETKPIFYDEERTKFTLQWAEEQLEKDFLEEGEVICAFPIVVVAKKGPAKFRACANFQPLNEVLYIDPDLQLYKGESADEIVAYAGGKKYKCILDCKEAHNGLVIRMEDRVLVGLLIPGKGTLRSKRGQFGMITVSYVFNKALQKCIGHLREKGVRIYADDITIFGDTIEECLALLEEVLTCLERDGFVVSAKKCKFFHEEVEILGQLVGPHDVRIAPKKVEAITKLEVPTTKKKLQQFIGCLTYVRKFLPNLATMLVPLYEALKGPEIIQLSATQLAVFEKLKQYLLGHQVLRLPNFEKPFYITITFGQFGYGASLLQKDGKTLRPIFFRSKTTTSETLRPRYLMQLEALAQALKDWSKVLYGREVRVLTDSALLKNALSFNGDDVQINRLLMKIRPFKPTVEVKPDSFQAFRFSQLLADERKIEAYMQLEDLLEEFEKENFPRKLGRDKEKPEVVLHLDKYDFNIFFDGACTRQKCAAPIGTYAVVTLNSESQTIYEEAGRVESMAKVTNNTSESYAMLRAVEYLVTLDVEPSTRLQIIGDSELVVKQLKGQYRVNSDALRLFHRDIKKALKKFKRVTLRNVPREYNTQANDLAQDALKKEIAKETQVMSFAVYAVHQPDAMDLIICQACGRKDNAEDMYLCDQCGQGQHAGCLGELAHPSGNRSFYCKYCEHYVFKEDERGDVTQDHNLIDYLSNSGTVLSRNEKARCERLSKFYVLKEDELFFYDADGTKRVPPVGERHRILLSIHQSLGHCGVANTVRVTKQTYFWPGLLTDVQRLIASCIFCQARKRSYLPMPQVYPTYKGLHPWQFLAVDLIILNKTDERGQFQERYILSVIDAYSKAPELIPLPSKSSQSTRQAFQDQVVCRYGCPIVVRSDDGTEFQRDFKEYLAIAGIKQITTGPRYPQGNGLVERVNLTIKQKLQSLFNSEEYSEEWVKLVQLVAFAIRVMKSRATGFSPFQILYGRDPLLPGHFQSLATDTFYEPSNQELTARLEALRRSYFEISEKIRGNLDSMNEEIQHTVEAREFKRITNLQFGQAIFVRTQEKATKLSLETEGPCVFIRYWDERRRDTIVYYQPSTRRYKISPICNVKLCDL